MKFRERTSVVCIASIQGEDHLLCFKAVDPTSGQPYYFLPGGALETGETKEAGAQRETLEETGYAVQVRPASLLSARYPFHWNGDDYDSLTHFFRGDLTEPWRPPGSVQDADYNKGPLWIPVHRIPELFSYKKEIQEAILKLI